MRRVIFIFITSLLINIYAMDVVPFNFTLVPYVNFFPEAEVTTLATGFISSNVKSISGIQVAPIFSTTSGDLLGVQGSGVFNISEGDVKGVQGAGVFNINEEEFLGVQYAGVFNISDGFYRGLQTAGVFNIVSNDFYGLQAAGVFNISNKGVKSVQTAGVFNISDDLFGLQMAGAFNIAGSVNGAQFGTVNVANGVSGLQVGVVNISYGKNRGAVPIGVINIYSDGIRNLFCQTDLDNNIYYGIETGSKNFYTQLFTGTKKDDLESLDNRIVGYGFGIKPVQPLDIVFGAKNYIKYMQNENRDNYPTPFAKLALNINLGSLSIYGGVEGDFYIDNYNENSYFFTYDRKKYELDEYVDIYYNFFVGVKLHI